MAKSGAAVARMADSTVPETTATACPASRTSLSISLHLGAVMPGNRIKVRMLLTYRSMHVSVTFFLFRLRIPTLASVWVRTR